VLEVRHGSECLLEKLESAIRNSFLLQQVLSFDAIASYPGFTFTMEDITVEEGEALQVLKSERNKYEHALIKANKSK
jgi:hypothetical protein